MSKIIVDIETVGVDFDLLGENEKAYLLKYSESDEKAAAIKKTLGLYPLTGEIVAIGMLNPETRKGCVLYQNGGGEGGKMEEGGIAFEAGSEDRILKEFWERVKSYRQVITFNGRGFDAPYLLMRSAVHKIRPTKNLMGYRYDAKEHCDLLDQLTFYGAVRKYNLDFYARAFGFESSKKDGMDGSKVGELYKKGKYLEIARYCADDLVATKNLYEIWDSYIRF